GSLAEAIRYATSRWPAMTSFVTDGRLEVCNNAAERAMRPIALGRHNWTFAGSDAGGERGPDVYANRNCQAQRPRSRSLSAPGDRLHRQPSGQPDRRAAAMEDQALLKITANNRRLHKNFVQTRIKSRLLVSARANSGIQCERGQHAPLSSSVDD